MGPTPGTRPPPLDHGVTGNGRILALVSPSGAVEWLCVPRFDSPSVFARLLDRERGGTCRILIEGEELKGRLSYLENTNVLCTKFERGGASFEVLDFAPRIPRGLGVSAPIALVRLIRPIRGQPRIRVDFDPRPDYARLRPELIETTDGLEVRGGRVALSLTSSIPIPYILGGREFRLDKPAFLMLSHGNSAEPPNLASLEQSLELTVNGWRAWSRSCALPSFAPAEVLRSALCLKLHAYHDTGAIIAAATTSIPEAMGTARTWDYRYCWLRDAAFTVEALRRIGQLNEGEAFITFVLDVVASGELQPVYAIDGGRDIEELMLPHLAGFGGNDSVRVGNAAASQRQNDLAGEVMLCIETFLRDPRLVHDAPDRYFPLVEKMVEDAIAAAPTPDMGIWEFRSMLKNHTFSRAMCWVAAHRGARIARRLGRVRAADRWDAWADEERRIIFEQGYNAELGFFTQSLGGSDADASNLLLALVGFIDPKDPRYVSTVEQYGRILVDRGLMLRYRNRDDLGVATTAFTICCFWWAEALALIGKLDEAIEVFDRIVKFHNPLGLFSEGIDPNTGALLGNFPQAYTHVGLINAAATIGERLEAREARVRAWG